MHELGIAHDLFRIIELKARENQLEKVSKINIVIGVASGVEKEFLEHSLVDHVLPGTVAASAEIEIKMEPLSIVCRDCSKQVMLDKKEMVLGIMPCPECGGHAMDIISGKSIYVESIEGTD